jgi:hypothetical protein
MGTSNEKDEMEDVETISPEQAKKEMQEAVKHVHEEEAKQSKSSTSKRQSTTSKQHSSTQGDEMEDVETISPEQAKKEMREAVQRVKQEDEKKKKSQ